MAITSRSSLILRQTLLCLREKVLVVPLTSSPLLSARFSSLSPSPNNKNDGNLTESQQTLILDVFVKKCGFTRSNLSLSLKKSHSVFLNKNIQFSDRPQQSISFLKDLGMKENVIIKMILQNPYILSYDVEKLMSNLHYFENLGMERVSFVKMLSAHPRVLTANLDTTLIPKVTYIKGILVTEKDLIYVLTRQPGILFQKLERIMPCIDFLQSSGICGKELSSLIVHSPRIVLRNISKSLAKKVNHVERLGFTKGSKMFMRALLVVDRLSEETLEKKIKNLKSFGLLDDEISRIVRSAPAILTLSTERVGETMDFLLNTLGLPANAVVRNSLLLTCNLESRIKSRLRVLDELKMMNLLTRKYSLHTIVGMTEKEFLAKFVACYSQSEQLHRVYKGMVEVGMKECLGT
eukprot:Gb_15465 [translate_table: standard]